MKVLSRYRSNKKRKKHRMLTAAFCAAFVFVIAALTAVTVLKESGLWFERPDRIRYPLRGVYITEESGRVNWKLLAADSLDFCYIRATKGFAFADRYSADNIAGASKYRIKTGLVHDFDFSSGGEIQAESFLSMCGLSADMLIPAIDIRMDLYERIRFRDSYAAAEKLNEFVRHIVRKTGRGALLLCDEYSCKFLDIGSYGAFVWTEKENDKLKEDQPVILSYSFGVRSSAVPDGNTIVLLAAGEELMRLSYYE